MTGGRRPSPLTEIGPGCRAAAGHPGPPQVALRPATPAAPVRIRSHRRLGRPGRIVPALLAATLTLVVGLAATGPAADPGPAVPPAPSPTVATRRDGHRQPLPWIPTEAGLAALGDHTPARLRRAAGALWTGPVTMVDTAALAELLTQAANHWPSTPRALRTAIAALTPAGQAATRSGS